MVNSEILPSQLLLGTYLYPLTFLSRPDFDDRESATEIIESIEINELQILITCMGGLFIEIPKELLGEKKNPEGHVLLDHLIEQQEYEQSACDSFNMLICELCLHGLVAQPASPALLGTGQLRGNSVYLESMEGSKVSYFDRVLGPAATLRQADWYISPRLNKNYSVLDEAKSLGLTTRLMRVSGTLPAFIAGSYSYYSQRQINEALIDAWFACEQLIDSIWSEYLDTLEDSHRVKRLRDTRTYSAAVRLEILHTDGMINRELYLSLNKARAHRNDLAHRAKNSFFATTDCVNALKQLIDFFLDEEVAEFKSSRGVIWNPYDLYD